MGTTKDIRDAVEAELEFDPLVDDADIHLVNITPGMWLSTAPCRTIRSTWRPPPPLEARGF